MFTLVKSVSSEMTLVRNDGSTIISLYVFVYIVSVYDVHIAVFRCIAIWVSYETLFHMIMWMAEYTQIACVYVCALTQKPKLKWEITRNRKWSKLQSYLRPHIM